MEYTEVAENTELANSTMATEHAAAVGRVEAIDHSANANHTAEVTEHAEAIGHVGVVDHTENVNHTEAAQDQHGYRDGSLIFSDLDSYRFSSVVASAFAAELSEILGITEQELFSHARTLHFTDENAAALVALLQTKYPSKGKEKPTFPAPEFDDTKGVGPGNWPPPGMLDYSRPVTDRKFNEETYTDTYHKLTMYDNAVEFAKSKIRAKTLIKNEGQKVSGAWKAASEYEKQHQIWKSFILIEGKDRNPGASATALRDGIFRANGGHYSKAIAWLTDYYENDDSIHVVAKNGHNSAWVTVDSETEATDNADKTTKGKGKAKEKGKGAQDGTAAASNSTKGKGKQKTVGTKRMKPDDGAEVNPPRAKRVASNKAKALINSQAKQAKIQSEQVEVQGQEIEVQSQQAEVQGEFQAGQGVVQGEIQGEIQGETQGEAQAEFQAEQGGEAMDESI